MLAYSLGILFPVLLFSLGFWVAQRVFCLAGFWRWALAYPIGLSSTGIVFYFLWLLGIPWNALVTIFVFLGIMLSKDLFFELRSISRELLKEWQRKILETFHALEPIEAILFAVITFSFGIITLWHLFIRPVVWDSLVLYDFRALRISEGWQIDSFLEQFPFDSRFAGYDFSHPFLSSIWQGVSYSLHAPVSSTIYIGLLLSVAAVASKVLNNRKSWVIFLTLVLASSQLFTVWTQNYAVEPYTLFWFLLILLSFQKETALASRPAIVLFFFLTTLMLRISEPYWVIFLLWVSWPILRSNAPLPQKLLQLSFWWLPSFALFAQWWQLQQEAASFVQIAPNKALSSYDLARYGFVWESFRVPEFWLRMVQILTVRNPLLPFVGIAGVSVLFSRDKSRLDKRAILLFAFVAMLVAAMLVEGAGDWPEWQGKARLLERAGIPIIVVATVLTAQRIGLQPENQSSKTLRTKSGE